MHAIPKEDPIRYEFDGRPETGYTMLIAPGIHWLRMHLPFSLAHINLWLLEDDDGSPHGWLRFSGARERDPENVPLVNHQRSFGHAATARKASATVCCSPSISSS